MVETWELVENKSHLWGLSKGSGFRNARGIQGSWNQVWILMGDRKSSLLGLQLGGCMLPSPEECNLAFVSAQGRLGLSLPVPSQLSPRGHASSRDSPVSIQFPSKGAKLPAYRTSGG